MSIKIEGGGSKENVFSDSDSGMPLWNGAPLLNLVYPVGSIYWSNNNTNPASLFGGTWTQIKDKFILAAGDSYSNGATGGASSVTLTINNMPGHNHTFTPVGNISMNSHNHTFTPSGNISINNHSHTYTPSGTISVNENPTFSGTAGTTSSNGAHTHTYMIASSRDRRSTGTGNEIWEYEEYVNTSSDGAHTHTYTPSGTISGGGYTFTGTQGYTSSTTSTGSFTGTQGYTSSQGNGTAFSILPPYIVKYCWERTA